MKNFKFSRLFAAALFVAVLALSGCKNVVQNNIVNYGIVGDWVDNTGAHYVITPTSFDNYGIGYQSYAGNNLVVKFDTETSGRIFIQYTRAYCATHSNPSAYSYVFDADAPDVGKWYALSFKNLTANSMKISGAAGTYSSRDSLQDAITEFTVANGYYASYSDVVKQ